MRKTAGRRKYVGSFVCERSTLPLLHHLHKVAEQVMRIMRTWGRLGMVLNREERHRLVPHALQSAIVQVEMRHFNFAGSERIWINRKVVVVRCDLDFPCTLLANWVVAAMMSELQLVSFSAQG